ncbi:hypothetical protein EE612_043221 [Oryza sativa]|nr:hypothetical protein EE612_043221 [Oryza sativa]
MPCPPPLNLPQAAARNLPGVVAKSCRKSAVPHRFQSSCIGAAHSALDLFVSSSKTVKVRPTCSLRMSSSAPVQHASFLHVGESVVVHPVWHRSGEIRNKRKRELELSAIASRTAVVQAPSTTLPISVQAANLESGEGSCDSYTSDAGTAKAGEDNVLHAANALTKVVPILQKRLSSSFSE